jgi:hypothetical protein
VNRRRSGGPHRRRLAATLAVAVVAGLVVGILTAFAQDWLSDGVGSLANSAAPWALASFLVARAAPSARTSAVAAVVTLWCCEVGYAYGIELRGDSNHVTTVVTWLIAGALAGPALGLAASWSTCPGWRHGAGLGALAGVLLGEAWYGWTVISDTTEWRYWAAQLAVGASLLLMAARPGPAANRLITITIAGAATIALFAAAKSGIA